MELFLCRTIHLEKFLRTILELGPTVWKKTLMIGEHGFVGWGGGNGLVMSVDVLAGELRGQEIAFSV